MTNDEKKKKRWFCGKYSSNTEVTFVTILRDCSRIRNRIGFTGVDDVVVDRSSSISNRPLPQIRLRRSVIEILVTYLACASIRDPRGGGRVYSGTNNSVRRTRTRGAGNYRKIDEAGTREREKEGSLIDRETRETSKPIVCC